MAHKQSQFYAIMSFVNASVVELYSNDTDTVEDCKVVVAASDEGFL